MAIEEAFLLWFTDNLIKGFLMMLLRIQIKLLLKSTADLDRCNGSNNTSDDLSGKIYVPNKTEKVNINVFSMIARINELKLFKNKNHANVNVNLVVRN